MLCTPPAFILSQDQTLEIIVSKHGFCRDLISLLSSLALSFFYFCWVVFSSVRIFRDPFQAVRFVLLSCCSIFNDQFWPRFRATLLLYHFLPRLSTPFLKLFKKFFPGLVPRFFSWYLRSPLEVSLHIIPYPSPLVKNFFRFFSFFLPFQHFKQFLYVILYDFLGV